MSALYFEKPDYEANASQTVDIALIGKTVAPLEAELTIGAYVSVDALNRSMAISNAVGWSLANLDGPDGSQKYPNVTFSPVTLVRAMQVEGSGTVEDRFLALNADAQSGDYVVDDDGRAIESLQQYMDAIHDDKFPASNFEQIPLEAVASVTHEKLECQRLADVLAAPVSNLSTIELAENDWALQLFAQAAAAGKIADTTDGLRDVEAPAFALGDSISVYVTYRLQKTRAYLLDEAEGDMKAFQIGELTITPGESTETSQVVSHMVEWKFIAA
jgi:hypothetical protein